MNMTSEDFINIYWSQYISLEKEFSQTFHYLSIDDSNELAYSQAYAKLMLGIGSEVDVVFKEYCKLIDSAFKSSYNSIGRYKVSINNNNPGFIAQEVSLINYDKIVKPWVEWNNMDAPFWWTAYNKVKHSRTSIVEIDGVKQEGYKFANQKYVTIAIAGLYQIMVYFYHIIATSEGKKIVTPLPGSRLFRLSGGIWDQIRFYDDIALYIDENTGCMMRVTSTIHY